MVSDFRCRCVWRRWESIKLPAARQPPWSSGEVESRWSENLPFPSSKAVLWARFRVLGSFSLQIFRGRWGHVQKLMIVFLPLWDLMGSVSKSMVVNLAGHKCCWCDEIGRLLHGRWEGVVLVMLGWPILNCFSRGKTAWQPGPTNYWSQWCFSSHCWNWSLGIAGVVFYWLKHYSGCYYVLMAWLIDVDLLVNLRPRN